MSTDFRQAFAQQKNILVVTAHPDDSAVILGGCIQEAVTDLGQNNVFVAVATDGEANQPKYDRLNEEVVSLNYLGIKKQNIFFAHLPDGSMQSDSTIQKYTTFLENLCAKYKITALITLGPENDGHPDHIATHVAAQKACQKNPRIKIFALNGNHTGQYNLKLTPQVSAKKFAAASLHKSQYSEPGWLINNRGTYSMGPKFGQTSKFYPPLQHRETFDRLD